MMNDMEDIQNRLQLIRDNWVIVIPLSLDINLLLLDAKKIPY